MPSHKPSRNYHENEFTSNKEKIPANLSSGNFNHDSKKSNASNKNGKKEPVVSLAERYKAIIAPSAGKKRPDPGSRNTLLKDITPEKVLKACKSQISSLKLLSKNTPVEIMFIRKDSNSSKMKEKEVILNFITLNSQFHNRASENGIHGCKNTNSHKLMEAMPESSRHPLSRKMIQVKKSVVNPKVEDEILSRFSSYASNIEQYLDPPRDGSMANDITNIAY